MSHKCFISFKTEDLSYKKEIQSTLNIDMIDKSLNVPIESDDEDYIMRRIREDYISDSTVTIHLIGQHSAENSLLMDQNYIKRELQASLYNGGNTKKNGILGVVLPSMYEYIYKGEYTCSICKGIHSYININDDTVVREFSYNYYIPKNCGCCWTEDDRYCVLVKWDIFRKTPDDYIEAAFQKRNSPVSCKTRVRP